MFDSAKKSVHQAQDRIIAYWSRYASEYEAHQRRRLQKPGELQAWEQVWAAALPKTSSKVLDLGTGTGHVAMVLSGLGHEVTGIDLSTGMLDEARSKARGVGNPPLFLQADAADPPFEPETFDVLTARFVLWTIRNPQEVLHRWLKLLRPGGRLVVVDGLWFPDGLLTSAHAATDDQQRSRDFHAAYEAVLPELTLAESRDISTFSDVIGEVGFVNVGVHELPEIMELDRRHGVAPNHAVQMCYRINASRPLE